MADLAHNHCAEIGCKTRVKFFALGPKSFTLFFRATNVHLVRNLAHAPRRDLSAFFLLVYVTYRHYFLFLFVIRVHRLITCENFMSHSSKCRNFLSVSNNSYQFSSHNGHFFKLKNMGYVSVPKK
jgi:hypothetical protein